MVELNNYLSTIPRLGTSGAISLLHLYAFLMFKRDNRTS